MQILNQQSAIHGGVLAVIFPAVLGLFLKDAD